jgi:hypothetical protein
MKIKVARIKNNSCRFDKMAEFLKYLLYRPYSKSTMKLFKTNMYDYIVSIISGYVEFIELEIEEPEYLTLEISNIMTNNTTDITRYDYNTEESYCFPKKFLYLWNVNLRQTNKHSTTVSNSNSNSNSNSDDIDQPMNNIGCFASLSQKIIRGICVLSANKYNTDANSITVFDDITIYDVVRIIKRRYFMSAILLKSNGDKIKYYYNDKNILYKCISDNLNINNALKITDTKISLFAYDLCLGIINDDNIINEYGSAFDPQQKEICGQIIVTNVIKNELQYSISVTEINSLLKLCNVYKGSDRKLNQDDLIPKITLVTDAKGNQISDKKYITPVWQKYYVVNRKLNIMETNRQI